MEVHEGVGQNGLRRQEKKENDKKMSDESGKTNLRKVMGMSKKSLKITDSLTLDD